MSKFKQLYGSKVSKYGKCDTIAFGYVLGQEKAFLIQNMCPLTDKYIKNEYLSNSYPVMINNKKQAEITYKAKKVLQLQRQGKKLIFPDVLSIEQKLINKNS